jgi:thiol-disulfide isomerase/thioredoxin
MGGLPALVASGRRAPWVAPTAGAALLASLVTLGCEGDGAGAPPPPPAHGRDEVVTAGSGAPTVASSLPTPTKTAKKPRKLCEGQASRPGPSGALETRSAAGTTPPDPELPIGTGQWVWLNFWAAWCKPCKEEMPRILAWEKKLRAAGVKLNVAFVSLDDDERQMQRFLDKQPPDGVRAAYFLPDGEPRQTFLKSVGEESMPDLPLQVLVGPSGDIACIIRGAVEDDDYPGLAGFLGAKP